MIESIKLKKFAPLFVMAHLISFVSDQGYWLITGTFTLHSVLFIGMMVSGLIWMMRPSRNIAYALFAVAFLTLCLLILPNLPNHRYTLAFIHMFLLARLIQARFKNQVLDEPLSTGMRVVLGIVYLFAALAKLNYGYFDPDISCAFKAHKALVQKIPFFPDGVFFGYAITVGSMLIEVVAAFELLRGRAPKWLLISLVLFHFGLALDMRFYFVNFSMVMWSLFLLTIESSKFVDLSPKFEKVQRYGMLFFCFGLFLLNLLSVLFPPVMDITHVSSWSWGLLAGVLLVLPVVLKIQKEEEPGRFSLTTYKYAIPVMVLILLNGFSPYLGIKTRQSFNMYSNMSHEAEHTNHFFMPRSLDLFGVFDDVYTVVEVTGNLPTTKWIGDNNMKITRFELMRELSYLDKGTVKVSGKYGEEVFDAASIPVPGFWQHLQYKFRVYRPVTEGKHSFCMF